MFVPLLWHININWYRLQWNSSRLWERERSRKIAVGCLCPFIESMDAAEADWEEIMRSIYCLHTRSIRTTNETEPHNKTEPVRTKGECRNFKMEIYIQPKSVLCLRKLKVQFLFGSNSQRFKHIIGVAAATSVSAYLIMSTILPVELSQATGFRPFLAFKCFVQNRNNNKQRERTTHENRMSRWLWNAFVGFLYIQTHTKHFGSSGSSSSSTSLKIFLPVLRALVYFYYYYYFVLFVPFRSCCHSHSHLCRTRMLIRLLAWHRRKKGMTGNSSESEGPREIKGKFNWNQFEDGQRSQESRKRRDQNVQ